MARRSKARRRRVPGWAMLFGGVLALIGITVVTEAVTRNPRLLPGLIALGALVVPISFVALVRELLPGAGVPVRAVITCFVSGGVIGTAAASLLEYDALHAYGVLPALVVGALEEPAKLLLPLIAFTAADHRRTADGLILGVAAGMGFAAFETMGYALGALVATDGGVAAAEDALLFRGVLSPCGHPAWTGMVCAALWWTRLNRKRNPRALLVAPAALLAAVLLHGSWDASESPLAQSAIGSASLVLFLTWLVLARRELRAAGVATAPARRTAPALPRSREARAA